ncbi:fumarate hydratase, class II [Roseospirillum parvum]|uniref:Fumarate hydratase class II n=2 Tax=Roseospirillum parvum TaxID=83401 RepID=A0A1G8AK77_9PROT|nr:fumarate hydratase, class II [Roseospirillum parvum]
MRPERDSLGDVEVPADRYWGAQTQRALGNFPIGTERMPLPLIHALGVQKLAAARANLALGNLDRELGEAISVAAREVAEGRLDDHFPLPVWQSGSGTQTNMNANEVIANRANEWLGQPLGRRAPVHPNDHVNRSQSSNDTLPTVMHLATLSELRHRLHPALDGLRQRLAEQAEALAGQVKAGRTHLQDAVPVTLGQEFGGHAAQVAAAASRLGRLEADLLPLAQGGTAVGSGLNCPPGFVPRFLAEVRALSGFEVSRAPNHFAANAAHDVFVDLSGALGGLAAALTKIAGDIRFLACGPRCGIGELALPANEPGSSIMPGKVNPTQVEALLMVCAQVAGNHGAVMAGAAGGQLELNACKPVILHNVLGSIRLLADAAASFAERCVAGLEPIESRLRELSEGSLMLVTALAPALGYDRAAEAAQRAARDGTTLRRAVLDLGLLEGAEYDRLVDPRALAAGGGAD